MKARSVNNPANAYTYIRRITHKHTTALLTHRYAQRGEILNEALLLTFDLLVSRKLSIFLPWIFYPIGTFDQDVINYIILQFQQIRWMAIFP